MSSGLYSGVSGLALGAGLYRSVSGLWGGASGLISGFGFSPALLFAQGEPGGWYDIDPAYMYQDSAGTTPVTAPGQTVGLVLDRSKGLVLGPELVTGSATPYTGNGTVSAAGGVYTATCTTNGNYGITFAVTSPAAAGTRYLMTFEVVTNSAPRTMYGWAATASADNINAGTTTGAKQGRLLGGVGTTTIGILGGVAGESFSVRNISVKELPGNHLTQSTLSNRAIYGIEPFGGRRNLLTYTEQFDNAAWNKSAVTITADAITAPDGMSTADLITETATNAEHRVFRNPALSSASQVSLTQSVFFKPNGRSFLTLIPQDNLQTPRVTINVITGAYSLNSPFNNGGAFISASSTAVGDGWYRVAVSWTTTTTPGSINAYFQLADTITSGGAYLGNGTSGAYLWGAQLEVGSTATAYQRVTDQWNVTEAGKTSVGYLQFDGSDDWLVSPTITPGIDKAQVFAGVRKLSDAAIGLVVESSLNAGANNGAMALFAPINTGANGDFSYQSRGTTSRPVTFIQLSPVTSVATGISDIAGDNVALRINGAQVASSALDQGTGNYLAYPLYVGRRAGTSLPYNGRIYSLIVRFGANLDAATITQTENWVAGKTGIYTVDQLNRLNARTASGTLYSAYAAADASSNNYLVTNSVRAADGTSYNVI